MKIHTRELFDENNLDSISDVQQSLETLEHDIPATHLRTLRNFNSTYLIITRNVRQQFLKGTFDDKDFLTKFDTRFAYYYFDALHKYIQHKTPSRPWLQAFEAAQRNSSSPFICMALGVNAHVNNDIPLVLLDCGAGKEHWRDYVRVNTIIKRSMDEVIDSLDASGSTLDPKHTLARRLYKPAIYVLITAWRYSAWRKYKSLKRNHTSSRQIEAAAQRTGALIDKLHFI